MYGRRCQIDTASSADPVAGYGVGTRYIDTILPLTTPSEYIAINPPTISLLLVHIFITIFFACNQHSKMLSFHA